MGQKVTLQSIRTIGSTVSYVGSFDLDLQPCILLGAA